MATGNSEADVPPLAAIQNTGSLLEAAHGDDEPDLETPYTDQADEAFIEVPQLNEKSQSSVEYDDKDFESLSDGEIEDHNGNVFIADEGQDPSEAETPSKQAADLTDFELNKTTEVVMKSHLTH